MLSCSILTYTNQLSAVPIFGICGQGSSWYNSGQNTFSCNPGWRWCSVTRLNKNLDLQSLKADVVGLDLDEGDNISVICSMDFFKKFAKMFITKQFVITYPVILDLKTGEELNTRLKTKTGGELALAPGTYKYERVGKNIRLRNIKLISHEEAKKKINALGDIEQVSIWDGSIPGLFQIKNPGIFIPSQSINKMVKLLNSTNGVKAEIVMDAIKVPYLKTTQQMDEVNVSQLHEITNIGPLNHIMGVNITCEGTCPNGCFTTVASGGWDCISCDVTGLRKCYRRTRGDYLFDRLHEINFTISAVSLDDSSSNPNNPSLIQTTATILGESFVLKATEVKVVNKEKFLLLLASNGTKNIILINKLETQLKTSTSKNWVAYYNEELKLIDKNISSLIRKTETNLTAGKKHDYVGHVTLLR